VKQRKKDATECLVRRADTISESARDYYDHRKSLLTRQHEIKLQHYEQKIHWKEERHNAKMQLLQMQMHYAATVYPTPAHVSQNMHFQSQ
jgi:hypothetical protein